MHELKVVLTDRGGEVFLNGRKVDSIGPGTVGDDDSCVLVIEDKRAKKDTDGRM